MAKDSKSADRPRRLDRVQREERWNKTVLYGTISIIAIVVGSLITGLILNNFVWPNQPIAIVGDTEISTGDYQKRVRYERLQLVSQYNQNFQYYQILQGGADTDQFLNVMSQIEFQLQPSIISQTVIQRMIEDAIIEKEAAERGIVVTDEEIEEFLRSAFNFFPDGTPTPELPPTTIPTSTLSAQQLDLVTPIPSATAFLTPTAFPTATGEASEGEAEAPAEEVQATSEGEEAPTEAEEATPTATLAPSATATLYSLEAYQEDIGGLFADYEDQINFGESDLRALLYNELLREKLREEITADTQPVEEQVWARHILVEDEATAKEVLERLDEGEAWSSLAVELSQDESNKNEAGNLGWFGFDAMVEPFAEAAFALEISEISEPVESAFGWHIIQVLGHEDRQLNDAELAAKRNTEFSKWLTEQRDLIDVEIMDFLLARTPDEPSVIPISGLQQQQIPGLVP